MIDVGFTGTQDGMDEKQKWHFHLYLRLRLLMEDPVVRVHLGDCIGADAEAYAIARALGCHTIGHPPSDPKKRAFLTYDEERQPKPYMDRNQDIVDESCSLFAAPKSADEELRSGTWSTVRRAQKAGKMTTVSAPQAHR